MRQERRGWLMRLGFIVLGLGTAMNVLEFTLAMTVQQGVMAPLVVMALFDASTIAYVFMHVTQLWHPEE